MSETETLVEGWQGIRDINNHSYIVFQIKLKLYNYDFRFGSDRFAVRFLRFVFIYRFHDPAVRSGSCLSIRVGSWAHCYILYYTVICHTYWSEPNKQTDIAGGTPIEVYPLLLTSS